MAIRTVRINLAGSYTGFGYHLLRVVKPVGAFTITDVRYYCDTVSAYSYVDVVIHAYDTDWDVGEILSGEVGLTTLKIDESAPGAGTWFLGDGEAKATPLTTGQAYSANHEVASGKNGAILIQGNKATGAMSTKVSSSPQTHNTSGDAIAALPAPDAGHVRLGYQTKVGPWTANTDNAITGVFRTAKRDSGANAIGCLADYLEFTDATLIVDSLAGAPYTESPGDECIVVNLYADENLTFTGGWVEFTYEDEEEDTYTARGEARTSVTVESPAPPTIGASGGGTGRAVVSLGGGGGIVATSRGEARAKALEKVALVTNLKVFYIGFGGGDPEARVTHDQVQFAGHQNPEGMQARVTHDQVQIAGRQNPEGMQGRVTFLSVQMLRVRNPSPPEEPPLPPYPPQLRYPGCTMYNVIRAGEEESGVRAERGTYRRLSGDIFLYRRELLQRLRMAYFDAEDHRLTLPIVQDFAPWTPDLPIPPEPPLPPLPPPAPPPVGVYTNEPAGYGQIMAHDCQAIPATANALAGAWYTWRQGDLSVVADGTEPNGDGNALRIRFRTGLQEGNAPDAYFGGWLPDRTEMREVYAYFTVQLEGASWRTPPGSHFVKMLGFLGYSTANNEVNNEGILGIRADAIPDTEFTFELRQQGVASGARNLLQNLDPSPKLFAGGWHKVECRFILNDIGQANGEYYCWIDGAPVAHYTNVVYRNATHPKGFKYYKEIPYWGGNSAATLSQDQYLRIGHIYLSGLAL